jgi:hypothetical protein
MTQTIIQQTRLQYLGMFLEQGLRYVQLSRTEFGRRLGLERVLVDALLCGEIPASQLDDDLLEAMADELSLDADVLRVILGRQGLITMPVIEDEEETAPAKPQPHVPVCRIDVRQTLQTFVIGAHRAERANTPPRQPAVAPVMKTLQSFIQFID